MLTPALVVVVDFGNILYWTAIFFGACFALAVVGGLVGGVFSLFDKTNRASLPLDPLYEPVRWEILVWRVIWLVLFSPIVALTLLVMMGVLK